MNTANLVTGDATVLATVLSHCAVIGADDQRHGRPQRTGKELAKALCSKWRSGHERSLRLAYSAGRFHIEAQGGNK